MLRRRGDRVDLVVRLSPRAARAGVVGVRDGRLVVRVTAPPVDGAANRALLEVLADACAVPRSAVTLLAGAQAREKRVSLPLAAEERLLALCRSLDT